jgi:hypothetical protein
LASFPTSVKEVVTLLVMSNICGKAVLHLTFGGQRDRGHSSGDTHSHGVRDWLPRLNQQSLRCHYSRCGEGSSEKHETAAEPGAEAESWLIRVVTVTVMAGGYRAVPESLTAITWRAKSATALRFRTCGRLYPYETLLQRLAQDLQDVASELRQLLQQENSMVRP